MKRMVMVAKLKEVISKVEQLNDEEQKRIAKLLEEEITFENHTSQNEKKYDEEYLKGLRAKAKTSWLRNINAGEWLKDIRPGYGE